MRDDLAKVICEKERSGRRDYMAGVKGYEKKFRSKNVEDRGEEYSNLEALPKYESMTKRLLGNTRSFNENLGAIRGLVAKNVGKNWDKLYSAICAQVSPTGTNIERHVHQHLPDFIYVKTRMGENSVEFHTGYMDDWKPVNSTRWFYVRAEYYVHPLTRCITKFKAMPKRAAKPVELTRVTVDDEHQLHKIKGLWYLITVAEIPESCHKKEARRREMTRSKMVWFDEREFIELPARDVLVAPEDPVLGRYRSFQLNNVYGRPGIYGVRKVGANHRTLKKHGLAA